MREALIVREIHFCFVFWMSSYLYILNSIYKNLAGFLKKSNLCFVSVKLKYNLVCDFFPKPSAFLTDFKKKQPVI